MIANSDVKSEINVRISAVSSRVAVIDRIICPICETFYEWSRTSLSVIHYLSNYIRQRTKRNIYSQDAFRKREIHPQRNRQRFT